MFSQAKQVHFEMFVKKRPDHKTSLRTLVSNMIDWPYLLTCDKCFLFNIYNKLLLKLPKLFAKIQNTI